MPDHQGQQQGTEGHGMSAAELTARLGDPARARDLLLPLSYARADGLPQAELWPALAGALAQRPYTAEDVDWLIEHAGSYLIAAESGTGGSRYRLRDEALARSLQEGRDQSRDEGVVTEALISRVPLRAGGRRDWAAAHPYITDHLAEHAAAGGWIDGLLTDPLFLLAARPAALLDAVPAARTPSARVAAEVYRRAHPRLASSPPQQRAACLLLAARCGGAPYLADAITEAGVPLAWDTRWVSWWRQQPHLVLAGHTSSVLSVTLGEVGGRTVVVSGGADGTVRIWDAATGTAIGEPLTGHIEQILSVAVGQSEERAIIVSGGVDATVRVWDAGTGTAIGEPLTGHADWVTSVGIGRLGERTVIVSGGHDTTVRTWDAATGAPVGEPFTGQTLPVSSVALAQIGRRAIVVSGGIDRFVEVSDAATGALITGPYPGHRSRSARSRLGSWAGAPSWSPAATTRRYGSGPRPPEPWSAIP
jgi:WD domain, G-beta repeat